TENKADAVLFLASDASRLPTQVIAGHTNLRAGIFCTLAGYHHGFLASTKLTGCADGRPFGKTCRPRPSDRTRKAGYAYK
ncbi:hypothetical protein, partial [Neisseria sp. P0014.S006]|uniref:hypothetical protein n=1 Tax=Neisseria sp. P0014.S006 TaxID=3436752 RepID=UPI003F7E20AC